MISFQVFSFKVADQTGCIQCSIWDEPGKIIQPGDIIRLIKCYASLWRGSLTLYSGKNGEIQRVGDFCMIFNEQLNMSSEPAATSVISNPSVATNGNGRAAIAAIPANHNSVPPPAETVKPSPKVGNSTSVSRNYIRKPPNKK